MHKLYSALMPLLILSACMPGQYTMTRSFSPSEVEPFLQSNHVVLTGQAFLRTRGGAVQYAAGSRVTLLPATPYFIEYFENVVSVRSLSGKAREGELGAEAAKYARTSTADGQGNFAFSGIAPGTYIIYCVIQWYASGSSLPEGGLVAKRLTVGDAPHQTYVLTRAN